MLPQALEPLSDLVTNLRWSWHPETQDLFAAVDPEIWELRQDPVRLLGAVSPERVGQLAPGGETVGHTDNYNCMRDNIPDVTVKYYDGLPHNICNSVPERCAEDALSFLQSRFPDGFSPSRT